MKTKFSLIIAILLLGLITTTSCTIEDHEDLIYNTGGIEDPVEPDSKSASAKDTGGIEDPVEPDSKSVSAKGTGGIEDPVEPDGID